MTSVLSFPSSTSSSLMLGADGVFGRSCASAASTRSVGTVQYRRVSSYSRCLPSPEQQNMGSIPQRYSSAALPRSESCLDLSVHNDVPPAHSLQRVPSYSTSPPREQSATSGDNQCPDMRSPDDTDNKGGVSQMSSEPNRKTGTMIDPDGQTCHILTEQATELQDNSLPESKESQPFRRWISRLRRRHQDQPATLKSRLDRWTLDDFDHKAVSPSRLARPSHEKSWSLDSSIGFVRAVKSATETLASASIATVSRSTSRWRSSTRQNSVRSGTDARMSSDSRRSYADEAAKVRSRKRRQKLEELIRTEESYVADIKALSNAYFTILGNQTTQFSFARPAAQENLADIFRLHDDILGEMHRIAPFAEYDQKMAKATESLPCRTHTRWHSVDVVPPRPIPTHSILATIRRGRRSLNLSGSWNEDPSPLRCNPQTIALIAKIFKNQINRFKVYEEYGMNYDLVQRDVEETQQSINDWEEFDRAIENLSIYVNPIRTQEANSKRAMTVKDLLIKPIQRLPRYELLFSDLCKLTPVCDDPEAHAALNELLIEIRLTCHSMNEAKDNPRRAKTLETSFLIGDRLTFSKQIPRSVFSKLLGPVQLCGCLYIAYRSRERIKGCYAICVLFQSTLLLAGADLDQQKYNTLVGIGLAHATIEESDNARGLQCHTAPHAWKMVFQHSARMYELVFVACSATEADVWRNHIERGIQAQSKAVANGTANFFELQSPLTAEMRSIGKAFGKPGSFVRRMSVHRAATVGPTTDTNQVIIKNTQAVKESQDSPSQQSLQITRSQSVASPSHIQTLAPRRAERHRLETLLADVWSRDLLPYPRMVRRSDPFRASANNVIRKFSMASIASNFSSSKRSTSYTSLGSRRKEESAASKSKRLADAQQHRGGQDHLSRPQLVDFHNAPEAFLPADFELPDPALKHKKSAFRTLTMTMERPFSPRPGNENIGVGIRRARSVRDGMKNVLTGASFSTSPRGEEKRTEPTTHTYSIVRDRVPSPASSPAPLESHDSKNQAQRADVKASKKARGKHTLLRLFNVEHRH